MGTLSIMPGHERLKVGARTPFGSSLLAQGVLVQARGKSR